MVECAGGRYHGRGVQFSKHGSRQRELSVKKVKSPCHRAEIAALESRLLLSTYDLEDWDTTTQAFVAHGTNQNPIPADYSVDVTANLQGAIDDVPNGNTLEFPALSYSVGTVGYLQENPLAINNRSNLTITGNGAILKRTDPGDPLVEDIRYKRHFAITGTSSNIRFEDVTIYGPNTSPHYDADRAFQHGFLIGGNVDGVTINNCRITNVYGDGVYTAFGGNVRHVNITNNIIDGTGRQGLAAR